MGYVEQGQNRGQSPIAEPRDAEAAGLAVAVENGPLFFGPVNLRAKKQGIMERQNRHGRTTSAGKANRALTPIFLFLLLFSTAVAAQPCGVLDPELKDSYAGPCVNGLAEGEGEARGTAQYRGGFKAGKKHGQGVKTWPNGDRYEGGFVEDRREGQGKYTWGRGPWQGEVYEGGYVADLRHGPGTYRWPSGDSYSGDFHEDRFAGYATPMMLARNKFAEEAKKAVAKEGQKVCREMQIGIAHSEWIRGVVVGVSGEQVGVRVDEPGKHRHVVAGVELQPGDVVWDVPTAWIPCF